MCNKSKNYLYGVLQINLDLGWGKNNLIKKKSENPSKNKFAT